FYWVAKQPEDNRALDKLAPASLNSGLQAAADSVVDGIKDRVWRVHVRNTGTDAVIALKLTLFHANGTRILPAYYSDNYLSLLPGEERTVTIQAPTDAAGIGNPRVSLRGWNFPEQSVPQGAALVAHKFKTGSETTASARNYVDGSAHAD